jgi:hypothetical protein
MTTTLQATDTKRVAFSALVPFAGFAGTWHSDAVEHVEEQLFADSSGNPCNNLLDMFFDHVSYGDVFQRYAENYVSILREYLELPSLTFEEMTSPRYYNFETDRVFASISRQDLGRMMHAVRGEPLDRKARKMFTSRSGFCSFYPNDTSKWPPIDDWDHNHVGAVLAAYADQIASDDWSAFEESIATGHLETSDLQDWLYSAADLTGQAAADLASIKRRLEEENYTRRLIPHTEWPSLVRLVRWPHGRS